MPEATPIPHPLALAAELKKAANWAGDEYRAAVALGRPLDDAQEATRTVVDLAELLMVAVRRDAVALVLADADGAASDELYAALLGGTGGIAADMNTEEDDR